MANNNNNNQDPSWAALSLRNRCECHTCVELGDASPHHQADHDQSLSQRFTIAGKDVRILGGTTKCARTLLRFLLDRDAEMGESAAPAAAAVAAVDAPAKGDFIDHALGQELLQRIRDPSGCRVVELGSGTALVGVALALLGAAASVTFTDQAPMLETVEANVVANLSEAERRRHRIAVLQWGADELDEAVPELPDVVIGSDLIFAKENIAPLVKTMTMLGKGALVYLVSITRFAWEDSFYELMAETFEKRLVFRLGDIEFWRFKAA